MARTWFGIAIIAALASMIPGGSSAQTARSIPSFRDCVDVCPEMVNVPAGKFTMGATAGEGMRPMDSGGFNNEGDRHVPVHAVTIRQSFAIGKYPVTREEFSAFVRETGFQPRRDCKLFSWDKQAFSWIDTRFPQTPRDPVICVSWYDAQAYVKWLSRKTGHDYRLPTEAQWEYAARAGTSTAFYWGEEWRNACRHANFFDRIEYERGANYSQFFIDREAHCRDGFQYTSPVDRFPPNAFGLYDMAGNVAQWVQDCWVENYKSAPADERALASGACRLRAIRGGSFGSDPVSIRAASRGANAPAEREETLGFRVVRIR